MREKIQRIPSSQIKKCRYCGNDIAWLTYASGKFYPAQVWRDRDGNACVTLGAGNYHNYKVKHDCIGSCKAQLASLKEELVRLPSEDVMVASMQWLVQLRDQTNDAEKRTKLDAQVQAACERRDNVVLATKEVERTIAECEAFLAQHA